LSATVVNGKIYAIGGEKKYGTLTRAVEVYDPATDTWTKKANMPTGRDVCAVDVVDGLIYLIGGWIGGCSSLKRVEAYDSEADTWTMKTNMPTSRWTQGGAVDGVIYVFGGETRCSAPTRAVEAYHPATDKWAKMGDMPFASVTFNGGTAPVVNGKIYTLGGEVGSYDPSTDTWTREPNLIEPRVRSAAAVVNDRIYAIGGSKGNTPALATVEEFTPEGWPFTKLSSVLPQGKLPMLWGALKSGRQLP